MNMEKLEKQFREEFTEEQRIKFLMMVGTAALKGLGWNLKGQVPEYAKLDIYNTPLLRHIQLVLGHVVKLVERSANK